MRYFKAIEITEKPYLNFALWAKSFEELERMGLEDDPLIIPESAIPTLQFKVYNIKIVAGELVTRTSIEMEDFEADYNKSLIVAQQSNIIQTLRTRTFNFDGNVFLMDDSARLIYDLAETLGSSRKIITADGEEYDLINTDIPSFMTAYRNELITAITV